MLCETCKKKPMCAELCQEAEFFVGQDYGSQKETITTEPMPDLDYDTVFDYPDFNGLSPGRLKELILDLHGDGMGVSEIAYHLPCTKQYASKVILKK